jgi:CMP-N-acetylneuraminic acid synthetase
MPILPAIKALIPIKAHSERVPNKNFRLLAGRPLFHWILHTLSASRHISEVIIDTDSERIANDARRLFGATVLMRPKHLCGDDVSMNLLIEYDISQVEGDHFFQTHATNPLLKAPTIDRAIESYFDAGAHDSLFSVTPWRKRFYSEDGAPINHDPNRLLRTQDLSPLLEENSSLYLYLFSRRGFGDSRHRIGRKPLLFPINLPEAMDIDDENDFQMVEFLLNKQLAARDAAPQSDESKNCIPS